MVVTEESEVHSILERLHALGVAHLTEWDALAFLYSHANSLGTAAQIARFIGHDSVEVVAALQRLEGSGLIERSRAHRGMRFFRISKPVESNQYSCLEELMGMVQDRTGRLLLLKHLSRNGPGPRRRGNSGLRFA